MTSSDWWAKKLQSPQPRQDVSPPMPPSQQPMTRYTPPQPQQVQTRAQSAVQVNLCPNCNSSNYMAVANTAPRCYDCGYPISQSGSKFGTLEGAKVEGVAKPAMGNNVTNNFNPQGIIGRVE